MATSSIAGNAIAIPLVAAIAIRAMRMLGTFHAHFELRMTVRSDDGAIEQAAISRAAQGHTGRVASALGVSDTFATAAVLTVKWIAELVLWAISIGVAAVDACEVYAYRGQIRAIAFA